LPISPVPDVVLLLFQECVAVLFWLVQKHSELPDLKQKAASYLSRAEEIQDKIRERDETAGRIVTVSNQTDVNPEAESDLKRAKFILIEAIKEDEDGDPREAIELYMEAVELCIKAKNGTDDDVIRGQLSRVADKAMTRAEELKGQISETADTNASLGDDLSQQFDAMSFPSVPQDDVPSAPKPDTRPANATGTSGTTTDRNALPSDSKSCSHSHPPVRTRKGLIVLGPSNYSKEEISVLKATSIINGREYVPFLSIDLKERFAYPIPYTDNEGMLALSSKQKERFAKWCRLDQLHPDPKIYHEIDPFSIKQTIVSDCSFLSSLMVTSLYEKKYNKRVISNIIYPQDKNGNPYYNPCGKYVVRLNVNGIRRKIIIDDYLPVDRHGALLCSYSSKADEFWVSILEKAYMEVRK
jgi:calpain-7